MKILALNYEYPPIGGGGGVGLKQYAESWIQQGHDVTVLCSAQNFQLKAETKNGVNIRRLPVVPQQDPNVTSFATMLSYIVSAILAGSYLIGRDDFDVMNTHFAVPTGPAGLTLSGLTGIPNIQTIIGGDIYDPSKEMSPHRHWWLRLAVRMVCSNAEEIVSISSDTAKRARRYYNLSDIDIIPYGFDPPNISAWPTPNELNFNPESYHLISIGRLIPRKGYGVLLEAIERLDDPEIQLHLIGDGPLREDLENRAKELSIEDSVTFEGLVRGDRKFHLLRASDAYVLSSLHEGLGIVVQEAMFSGLPIVATNNGGQTDLLENGDNAYLVPPENPRKLAKAIEKLRKDPESADRMAKNNRQKIKNYSVDKMAKRYLEKFQKILSERETTPRSQTREPPVKSER